MYKFQSKLERDGEGGDLLFNKWIWIGNGYYLSIQCSKYHYCSPKKNIKIQDYEEYEVSIIGKRGNDCIVENNKSFNKEIKEIFDKYEDDGVMGYVPASDVEKLYLLMLKEWGEE